jgi:hypothetical protein
MITLLVLESSVSYLTTLNYQSAGAKNCGKLFHSAQLFLKPVKSLYIESIKSTVTAF